MNVLLLPIGRADDGAQYVSLHSRRDCSSEAIVTDVARRTRSWMCPALLKGYVWCVTRVRDQLSIAISSD